MTVVITSIHITIVKELFLIAPVWMPLLGLLFLITGIYNFLYTLLGDPGIPNQIFSHDLHNYNEPNQKFCSICLVHQLGSTYHCPDCNVCILGHDHHCIFYGKCIGKGNY